MKLRAAALIVFWLTAAGALWAQGAGQPEAGSGERTAVTFVPQWQPQAQFAGYYVALEKGFYARHGLDVTILRGGPQSPSTDCLVKGAAQFATMFLSTAIQARARGDAVVNIGQIVRKSTLLLIAKKSNGIRRPEDMQSKKVGLWSDELSIQPRAFFKKYGLSVRVVPQAATVNLFLRGGVDVVSAMWYNEYHTLVNSGLNPEELAVFRLSDYGTEFPEDGIYCLESTLRANPKACCHFIQASIEGWHYAFDHPEEALDIVMKVADAANIATDRMHQKWMLQCLREVIFPPGGEAGAGVLTEAAYTAVAQELAADGLIDTVPAYGDFFSNCVGADAK